MLDYWSHATGTVWLALQVGRTGCDTASDYWEAHAGIALNLPAR